MRHTDCGLVACVDRETVRFALANMTGSSEPFRHESMEVARFTTFTSAIETYLRDALPNEWPSQVVITIAGIPTGDTVNVLGGRWRLSLSGLESYLRRKPLILNDFAASIFAVPQLPPQRIISINAAPPVSNSFSSMIALVGPLQGLGVAGLTQTADGKLVAVQSEAGNATLGLYNEDEQAFVRSVLTRTSNFVPEHLLSEEGLLKAFQMFSGISDGEVRRLTATRVVLQSQSGDRHARRAVALFSGALAEFLRAVVMSLGSWNGIYLSGPLARSLASELRSSQFISRFEGVDRYRRRLAGVPISVVLDDDLDLRGASIALRSAHAAPTDAG